MNIMIVGSGKGSWTMRGVQIGQALGARVTSAPTDRDWAWAERVILVKRAAFDFHVRAQRSGVPIVWDALDFWRQPADNAQTEAGAMRLLRHAILTIKPALVIGATEAMARAAGGVCVPHHGRLGLRPTLPRERFRVIGYDGNPIYLGRWESAIRTICARNDWTFVVNPPDLSACDLLVAFRDGPWDGWVCNAWKSGVKLVNAMLAGRPIVTQDTAAWREIRPAGLWVRTPDHLLEAVEFWISPATRQTVYEEARHRAEAYTLDAVAARYRDVLARVGQPAEATC